MRVSDDFEFIDFPDTLENPFFARASCYPSLCAVDGDGMGMWNAEERTLPKKRTDPEIEFCPLFI